MIKILILLAISVLFGRLLKYFAFTLASKRAQIYDQYPEHGKKVVDGRSTLIEDDENGNSEK